jgi:hypothetical protein
MGHLTTISSSSKLSRVGRNGEPDKKAGSEPKNLVGQPQNERLVGRFQEVFSSCPRPGLLLPSNDQSAQSKFDVASTKNLTTLALYPVKKAMSILGEEPNPDMR